MTLLIINSCKKSELDKDFTSNLEILVVDKNDKPISDSEIEILTKLRLSKKTNSNGVALFDQVTVGEVTVVVKKIHFLDQAIKKIVKKDQENTLKVTLNDGEAYLELDREEIVAGEKGLRSQIRVTSNAAWTVESKADWIKLDVTSGNGNIDLYPEILLNNSDSARESTIDFKISDSTFRIKVIQKIDLRLIAYTGGTTPLSDSIFLTFNKPVKINRISNVSNLCIPADMGHKLYNKDRTVKFRFGCARLVNVFPIHFSVTDYDGQTLSETVQIEYFSRKMPMFSFRMMLMDPDGKHLWVITRNPNEEYDRTRENKLIKINLESFEVVQDLMLPAAPIEMAYNPYNKYIYVTTELRPEIYVVDTKKNKIEKTIHLKALKGDNDLYPYIYPHEILFTNSGFGVVNVGNIQTSGGVWKAIDATLNDTIYHYPGIEDQLHKTIKSMALVNGGKEIVGYLDGESPLFISGVTKKYGNFFESPVPFPFNPFFFSNPKGTKILITGYWEQALVNVPKIDVVNRSYDGVVPWAFSNLEGEENHVFAITGVRYNNLALLNYSKAKTELFFPSGINYNVGCLAVSKDNKYYIAAHNEMLYRFDNVMFSSRYNYDVLSPTARIEMQAKSKSFR